MVIRMTDDGRLRLTCTGSGDKRSSSEGLGGDCCDVDGVRVLPRE